MVHNTDKTGTTILQQFVIVQIYLQGWKVANYIYLHYAIQHEIYFYLNLSILPHVFYLVTFDIPSDTLFKKSTHKNVN